MDGVHVEDFGAVGDGVTPDHEAIQAAITKAIAVNKPVHFDARTYRVEAELIVPDFVALCGTPRSGSRRLGAFRDDQGRIIVVPGDGRTILQAGAPIRSVLSITGDTAKSTDVLVRDIVFEGARKAIHGVYIMGCSNSTFDRITVGSALSDGIHLTDHNDRGIEVINDNNTWTELEASQNGTLLVNTESLRDYYTAWNVPGRAIGEPFLAPEQAPQLYAGATAAVVTGNQEVKFSGLDFSALDLPPRPGDPLRIGTGDRTRHLYIYSVMDDTLVASEPFDYTASGLDFAIGIGDGYHEVPHRDNNHNSFYNGILRRNAGYAFAFNGAYGPVVVGHQIDLQPFWGMRFGLEGGTPVIGTRVLGAYFEAIDRKPFLLRATNNIGIYNPMDEDWKTDPIDYGGHPENNIGLYVNVGGLKPIGTTVFRNEVPTTNLLNASVNGSLFMTEVIMQQTERIPTIPPEGLPAGGAVLNVTGPNDPGSMFARLRAGLPGDTFTLTGEPTFVVAGRGGKLMILKNDGEGTVTLQDHTVLPGSSGTTGSRLRLSSPRFTMEKHDTIVLVCDGEFWFEVSRSQNQVNPP
jgi:hypothetical protein